MAGTALVAALHLVGAGAQISPVRLTISEYGLAADAWAFQIAVVIVAGGAAAVLAAALRTAAALASARGGPSRPSARLAVAAALGALCVVGLIVVALVPKTDWAVGPSVGGTVHRIAGLVAFLGLPATILLLLSGPAVRSLGTGWIRVWAAISPLWFLPIVIAIIVVGQHGQWWLAVPLGLLERGLAATEMVALLLLARWARRHR